MDYVYVSVDEAYFIHEKMIEVGGGRKGIRDFTLLHSAVERPKVTFGGKMLYPTIWLQAGALMQSLVKNHPFSDGNKRTAYFSTLRFLNLNKFTLNPTRKELIEFCVHVDTEHLSVEDIASWLKTHSESI